ncbi:protein MFI [Poeciliopsis prolifica]|uniref:protein MFI n=1 Tax=Poeciliopsis prolifica TaxID=188132 RepID=UPI0024130C65|nr:protein MFI [Poeciliopsis prolifica]
MATPSLQKVDLERSQRDQAAKILQRGWRRYVCKEVFRHVKRMIGQCYRQDPKSLLKTVNPREAELLDPAAGVFIRFRLGGVSFPPQVYYKIFTYRPIVDVCASSPKNYNQLLRMRHLTEERDPTLLTTDQTDWYQRVENNNWRIFSCKFIAKQEFVDSIVVKQIDFHPSKLQRIEDLRKWRKRRKIEWLKRMYRDGQEEEEQKQSELLTVAKKTVKDVMHSIEDRGEDEILDWELDEILAWTSSLNFEDYWEQWKCQACSETSEMTKG